MDDEDQSVFITAAPTYQQNQNIIDEYMASYEELNLLVDNIDQHFVRTLTQYESDFVVAYKGQMLKVQKELKFLKAKQNEVLGKLMGDDEITSLQRQIKWFKATAIKLNEILERQKVEIQASKFRKATQDKDHQFLNKHVKEVKQKNRLIQQAIEVTEGQNQKLASFWDEIDKPQKQFQPGEDLAQTRSQFDTHNLEDDIAPKILTLVQTSESVEQCDQQIIAFFEQYDKSLEMELEFKSEQLALLKRQNKKLLNKQASDFTECSEFEKLLLDAVDVCRKDVVKS